MEDEKKQKLKGQLTALRSEVEAIKAEHPDISVSGSKNAQEKQFNWSQKNRLQSSICNDLGNILVYIDHSLKSLEE